MSEDRVYYAHLPPFDEEDVSEKVDEVLHDCERQLDEIRSVLSKCTQDLEQLLNEKYGLIMHYPDAKLRYEEDMTTVRKARRLLEKYK